MTQRALVIGRTGQVARELALISREEDLDLDFVGREDLDLWHVERVAPLIEARQPEAVIVAAAYTKVDAAETDQAAAQAVNRDAPGVIAQVCARLDIPMVHFSTDYVFDGFKHGAYVESDPRRPTTIYGRSKSAGEDAVRAAAADAVILRTAWVFSAHGSNFVKTMLRLAVDRDEVGVVADQIGNPTWARTCARAAAAALRHLKTGGAPDTFHVCDEGAVSWADFAGAIFETSHRLGGPSAKVRSITTAEYPTPARRPANSRLDTEKIQRVVGWSPQSWSIGLESVVRDVLSTGD